MNRRTLLSAVSSGTIVGLAGCLSGIGEPRSSESDPEALSWVVPRDDECVSVASLSELVARRFDDTTVSGRRCATIFVENRRDEPITAVVTVDRPLRLWDSDEKPDSFELALELEAGEGHVLSSIEPAPEVTVTVTIDDERLQDRWTGPPCYHHVLEITDDGIETDSYPPCWASIGVENDRDEPITPSVTVDSDRPERYEATFDVAPGDVEYDGGAFRPAEDLEVAISVDEERFQGQWTRKSCHRHVVTVTDGGLETDIQVDCEPPLVVENERDEPVTATVDVDTERSEVMIDRADSKPFVETFDLAPGERAFEPSAFYAKMELDVTVTVDGEEFHDQWVDPACFAHAIAIIDDGITVGEVPTIRGDADFQHSCLPGSAVDLLVYTGDASHVVDVTIDDRCTGSSTTETLEMRPDEGRRVPGLRAGPTQEVTVSVDGGESVTDELWNACWRVTASIGADGSVNLSRVPTW